MAANIPSAETKAAISDEHEGLQEAKMLIREQKSYHSYVINSIPQAIIESKRRHFNSQKQSQSTPSSPYLALLVGPNQIRLEISRSVMVGCFTLTSLLRDGDPLEPPTPDDPIIKVHLPRDSPWAFEQLINWLTYGSCSIDVFAYHSLRSGRSLLRVPRTAAGHDLERAVIRAWILDETYDGDKCGLNWMGICSDAALSAVHEVFRHMVELYSLADYFYIEDLRKEVSRYLRGNFKLGPREILVALERLGPLLEDPRDHQQDLDEENRRLYELIIASYVEHSDLLHSLKGLRDLELTNDERTRNLLYACQSADRIENEWATLGRAIGDRCLLLAERDVDGIRLLDGGLWSVRRGELVLVQGIEERFVIGLNARGHLGRVERSAAFREVVKGAWM
ncbi:MAG: hypothetical protein M1812_006012 [Candelaria pacifica]|nr:MAG: hypothetical protein M1812_006012 [Candelaria pacifica]